MTTSSKAAFEHTEQKPVPLTVEPDGIPQELRALDQWVCWRYERKKDHTGDEPWSKVPKASGGGPGDSTKPETWSPFQETYDYSTSFRDRVDGIGFVFADGGGLCGIDLDDALGSHFEVLAWARPIIADLNSYCEISPSGTGVKIFVRGQLPENAKHKKVYGGGEVELYDRWRYFATTGRLLPGALPTVEERQVQLDRLYRVLFPPEERTARSRSQSNGSMCLDDQEVLRLAFASRSGDKMRQLYEGTTAFHGGDDSRADLALCNYLAFWCGRDRAQMDRIFRESGLMRLKWDRSAGEETYGVRTLNKAIKDCAECYGDRRRPKPSTNGAHTAPPDEQLPAAAQSDQDFHLTDLGNARRVVARHGANWRHCHPFKRSYVFDGRRWVDDDTGAVPRLVKETQGKLYNEVAQQIANLGAVGDDPARKQELARLVRILKHCLAWEDAKRVKNCIQLGETEPGIPILPPELDRDHFALNCLNGTLDLISGELRPHRREDLITKITPIEYLPDAKCPLWDTFLERIMGENQCLIVYLQRASGYSLTGDVGEQCLFFLHGHGANGKSTFLATLKGIVGDYGLQAVPELLMSRSSEAHPTERADLFGRRFVCTIETEEGRRMAESLMKQMTGGDKMRARKMRQDFFEFDQTWKIWLAANHKPQVRGTDLAAWRRIKLIPFTVTIPDDEKDKDLAAKLRSEWPGILAWMVRGCLDWKRDGLAEPQEVTEATTKYRSEQDTIQSFLDECCLLSDEVKTKASLLLEAYILWSGEKNFSSQSLKVKLNDKQLYSERGSGGVYFYKGVGLHAGYMPRNDRSGGNGT